MMINRLLRELPNHRTCINTILNPHLYIVDWKDDRDGNVEISGAKRERISSVHLFNPQNIKVVFDGFPESGLPIRRGYYSKQCECVIFPFNCNTEEWVLFIETKYANNLEAAKKEGNNYPYCMIKQIKDTVKYFRNKGIISPDKTVHAIASFPNLIGDFNSWMFPIKNEEGELEDILNILHRDKIIIRGTNEARIIDSKTITLL